MKGERQVVTAQQEKKAESNDSFVHSQIHAKVVSPGVPP